MVVVDDLAALNDAESRFGLGRSPPAGIRDPHRNGIAVLAARKGISLRRSDANLPVWVRSAGLSEDGAAATQQEPSADETALAFASFPPEKRDIRRDNMRPSSFTTNKDNAFSYHGKAPVVLLDCLGLCYTDKLEFNE